MEDLKAIFDALIDLMKMPFTIHGFTLSLWGVFIWTIVAGLVIWAIVKIFGGSD